MAYAYGLMPMYGITASIGTSKASGGDWTYAPFGDGIDNLAEALNEIVQQYFFLTDNGFAKNHVTGMAPTFTATGRRVYGDAAQDYIFSQKYGLDAQRISSFKMEYEDKDGKTVTLVCPCTIANVQEFSGATTDDSAISMEIRFDGKPTITTA